MPILDSDVVVSPDDIKHALKYPDSFGYSGDNADMFRTWSLGPVILTRDSRLLDQSNSAAVRKHLESDESLADDWEITGCSHWAVGWVEHLSYRIVEEDGVTPTRIARVLAEWFGALSEYPVADEMDYSERELNATFDNIADAGRRFVKDNAPTDWVDMCYRWFDEHDQRAIESRDDEGGYPSDEQIKSALAALGYLDMEV